METTHKLTVLWVTTLLLVSAVSGPVALAQTTSGGNTAVDDLGNAPTVELSDATIDDSTDSQLQLAYKLPDGATPSDYALSVSAPGWDPGPHLDGTVDAQSGTVTLTVPADTYGGGTHRLSVQLYQPDPNSESATDTALLTVESPVTITDYTVDGPTHVNEDTTVTATLDNPTDSSQQFTLSLYDYYSYSDMYFEKATKTVSVPADGTTTTVTTSFDSSGERQIAVNAESPTTVQVDPSLDVTNVAGPSDPVTIGEAVTLTATVTNAHGPDGAYDVTARDRRERVSVRKEDEQFNAGETRDLTFQFTPSVAGEHTVEFSDGTETTFTVESPVDVVSTSFDTLDDTPIYVGDTVTLDGTVKNTGTTTVTETLTVGTSYRTYAQKDVSLDAGQEKSVSFDLTFDRARPVTLSLGDVSHTLDVKPALTVLDASASTQTATVGETVTVTATVENTHGEQGTYTVRARDSSSDAPSKTVDVTLAPGATDTVTFDFVAVGGGPHSIRVGDDTEVGYAVDNPLDVQSFSLSSDSVVAGETVTVDATVVNTADTDVSGGITARGQYDTFGGTSVSVPAGETKPVSFDMTFDDAGQKTVYLSDRSFTVDVVSPYEVTDTSLSTDRVAVGEDVTLTATVEKVHDYTGPYHYSVSAYPGGFSAFRSLDLATGETTTVTATASFSEAGDGQFSLLGETVPVAVYNPVEAASYSLSDDRVQVGESTTVTATVENTGETAGTFPVRVTDEWGHETYGKTTVTLDAGEQTAVTFDATFDTAKHYSLRVNGHAGPSLVVTNPVSVTDYTLSSNSLYTGEQLTITAAVENTGQSGTYPVALTEWGRVIGQTTVTLDAGETTTKTFTVTPTDEISDRSQVALNDAAVDDLIVKNRVQVQDIAVDDGVSVGEQVTVDVTYHNPTAAAGSTYVDTTLGREYDGRQVALSPGESETVTMTGTYDTPGQKWEGIGERSVNIYVVEDTTGTADVNVVEGQALPTQAIVGTETYIPVRVENTGDAAGVEAVTFSVDGTEIATKRAYAEPGQSGWVWARHTFTSTGDHTLTVDGETTTITVTDPVVTDATVEHIGGTAPVTMPTVEARFGPGGGINAFLQTPAGHPDIARLGADTTSEFRVTLTLRDYTPRVLVNTGSDTTWTTTQVADGKTEVTIETSPSQLNYLQNAPQLEQWESTSDTADFTAEAGLHLTLGDATGSHFDAPPQALSGLTVSTDAQKFRQPQYYPGDGDSQPRIEVKLGAPHLTEDGTLNEGHYRAFVPESLLDEWGVTDAEQLTVDYTAADDTQYTIDTVEGGLLVDISLHYSSGTVTIAKESTSGGGGGGGGGGSVSSVDDTTATPTATQTATPVSTTTADTETSTATPSGTSTETPTSTANPSTTERPQTTQTTSPGFGALVALFALVSTGLVALRRD